MTNEQQITVQVRTSHKPERKYNVVQPLRELLSLRNFGSDLVRQTESQLDLVFVHSLQRNELERQHNVVAMHKRPSETESHKVRRVTSRTGLNSSSCFVSSASRLSLRLFSSSNTAQIVTTCPRHKPLDKVKNGKRRERYGQQEI